jgi:exodeoxyribonuclease V alpha subunit
VGDRVQDRGHDRRHGIARDSPERIKAGLAYTLSEAADDGHCYLPAPNLIGDAAKILDVPAELISPCLEELTVAEGWSARRSGLRRPSRAGPRRLPAALLSGRTVRGSRPAPPACRAG